MKVWIHAVGFWETLHEKEVEVVDAYYDGIMHTCVSVAVNCRNLNPPINKDVLEGLILFEDFSFIGPRCYLAAVGSRDEAWEQFINPKRIMEAEAYERRNTITTGGN